MRLDEGWEENVDGKKATPIRQRYKHDLGLERDREEKVCMATAGGNRK